MDDIELQTHFQGGTLKQADVKPDDWGLGINSLLLLLIPFSSTPKSALECTEKDVAWEWDKETMLANFGALTNMDCELLKPHLTASVVMLLP